jgi:hypothetical protein
MAIGIFTLRQQLRGLLSTNWPGAKTPYVEYLVVGGGGGAGLGGGGGGGVITGLLPVITGTTYTVTVGGGGAGGPNESLTPASQGSNSSLGSITAVGGGKGGTWYSSSAQPVLAAGGTGGSGGGAAGAYIFSATSAGAQGVFGLGNAGGSSNGTDGVPRYAGGGGGAGTIGITVAPGGSFGGNGGAGIASAISGTVTAYGGGGGGGRASSGADTAVGSGGAGGGGGASTTGGGTGTAGSANTGGGGGGGNAAAGGAGGSGIVIVSYPDNYAALTSTTGSPTVSTSGSGSIGLGSTTYLRYAAQTPFGFGSGDFTIEGWFNASAINSLYILFDFRPNATNGAYPYVFKDTNNLLYYYVNTASRITGTTALVANTWYHIAICRVGTNTKMFLNGSQEGSTYTDTTTYLISGAAPTLFAANDGLYSWNGYISNFRVVKGVGVYTGSGASAFVVPTAPLQATQAASTGIAAITGTSTSLLLNTVSGAWSADSSTNSYAPASVGGTPNWNQSSPFATGLGYKNRVYSWTTTGSGTFTV